MFFSSECTVFYSIHSFGQLVIWNLAQSKQPESVNELKLKDNHEVTAAQIWANPNHNQFFMDFLVYSFDVLTRIKFAPNDFRLKIYIIFVQNHHEH